MGQALRETFSNIYKQNDFYFNASGEEVLHPLRSFVATHQVHGYATGEAMNWSEQAFITYLKAVDDTLEAFYGRGSDADEFEVLADLHHQNVPPETAALRLRGV